MVVAKGVPGLVDHLFRRSAGRMIAALTRILGPHQLDLAEEVVQEALLKALQVWPFNGVPTNPEGWLFRVARNAAMDRVRRSALHDETVTESASADLDVWFRATSGPESDGDGAVDDELALIFMCCDPDLPREMQLALTLKTAGGFSVEEIAAALLAAPSAIAQRIVRAKRILRERGRPLMLGDAEVLGERLGAVLRVLYLLFNEGYSAHSGDAVVRSDLCAEAVRLCTLLARRPDTARPETHALLALMLLQGSRLAARSDAAGALLLLEHQSSARWDRSAMALGFHHLDLASEGEQLTDYHIEAGIAACHAAAPSYEETDWGRILELYDLLLQYAPSPIVRLNRAVALRMIEGPAAAISALEELEKEPTLSRYLLLPATLADFLARVGEQKRAAHYYRQAIALAESRPQREFLEGRLRRVERRASSVE